MNTTHGDLITMEGLKALVEKETPVILQRMKAGELKTKEFYNEDTEESFTGFPLIKPRISYLEYFIPESIFQSPPFAVLGIVLNENGTWLRCYKLPFKGGARIWNVTAIAWEKRDLHDWSRVDPWQVEERIMKAVRTKA